MATCIFKYFDFLEKIEFENGDERIFDGLECNFYEENLKTALFCNTTQQTFVGLQDILKTSLARLQRNNFTSSKTSWRRLAKMTWRSFQDLSQDVFKTSRKTKNCYAEDVFKTSRRQTKFLLVISVSNKPKCVSNKFCFKNCIWEI